MATGLLALILAMLTVLTAIQARALDGVGLPGIVQAPAQTIFLRAEPQASADSTGVVRRGQEVRVIGSQQTGPRLWYRVETEDDSGWVPAEQVRIESP